MYVFTPGINTTLLPKDQAPKTFADLLDPKLKGKMAWNGSSMAGAFGFVANILTTMGEDKGMDYLRALAKQQVVNVDASSRAVLDQVIAGEYWINLMAFNHHTVISARKGAPCDWLKIEPAPVTLDAVGLRQGRAASERRAAAAGIFAVRGRAEGVSAERLSAGVAERSGHGRRACGRTMAASRRTFCGRKRSTGNCRNGKRSRRICSDERHRGRGLVARHRHDHARSSRALQRLRSADARRVGARNSPRAGPTRQRASSCSAAAASTFAAAPIWWRAAWSRRRRPGGFAGRRAGGARPLPKPTIAVVHGAAVGGGAALAACCDMVLAADSAFFSIPEVRVGMAPLGVAPFMIRAMGPSQLPPLWLVRRALRRRRSLAHRSRPRGLERRKSSTRTRRNHRCAAAWRPGRAARVEGRHRAHVAPPVAAIIARRASHGAPRSAERRRHRDFKEKRKPSWYPQ